MKENKLNMLAGIILVSFTIFFSPVELNSQSKIYTLEDYENNLDSFKYYIRIDLEKADSFFQKEIEIVNDLKIDSLYLYLSSHNASLHYHNKEYDKAISKFEDILNNPLSKEFYNIKFTSYRYLIVCHYFKSDWDKVDSLNHHVLSSFPLQEKDKAIIFSNMGGIFISRQDFDSAIKYLLKADNLMDDSNVTNDLITLKYNLASSYYNSEDYVNAIKQFKSLLKLAKEIGLNERYKYINNLIGASYINLDSFAQAETILLESIEINKGNQVNIGIGYHYLGKLFLDKNELNKAEKYNKDAYQMLNKVKGKGNSNYYLTKVLIQLIQISDLKNDYKNVPFFKKEIEQEFSHFLATRDSALLEKIYIKNKLRKEVTTETFKEFSDYLDSRDIFFNNRRKEKIHENLVKYETEKKELKNDLLSKQLELEETENSKKTAYLFLTFLALISTGLLSFIFYRKNKQKAGLNQTLEKRINQMQVVTRELQHRTNGQFNLTTFFINEKKEQAQNGDVSIALEDTENWMYSLSIINKFLAGNSNGLTIKNSIQEIAENLKFGAKTLMTNDLEIDLKISPLVVNSNDTVYLGMMINELLTNSIKYAFTNQPLPKIDLEIKEIDKTIFLQYRDNGVGHKKHKQKSGQGLSIVNDIIQQLNGTYEINVDSGFQFTVQFPNLINNER